MGKSTSLLACMRAAAIAICAPALFAVVLAVGLFGGDPVFAQSAPNQAYTLRPAGFSSTVLTASSNSTTPVDLVSITFTPVNDPTADSYRGYLGGSGFGRPYEHVHIWWSADISKATTLGASCKVYVNGALVTATLRTTSPLVGEFAMSGFWDVALTASGSQVVKVQCYSNDTAVATFNAATLYVEEAYY